MTEVLGCSVITTSYLPYARVLAESFHEHNPNADFAVLLVDDREERISHGEPFRVIRPSDIGISLRELAIRGLMYTPTELVCSLRPAFLRHLLQAGADAVILLDGDGYVCAGLKPIAERAHEVGTLFTAHFLAPHPPPGAGDSLELVQIRYGVMNGGFIAVGPDSIGFLEWLHERLARHCLNAPEQGLYLDQRWLDLAVALFPSEVLKDAGCNVMCLNLHHRDVIWTGDRPSMPEGPLRYFHFLLAFDPEHPDRLCNEQFADRWLPYLSQRPGALRLAREYSQRLLAQGSVQAKRQQQYYDALPDGPSVDRHMRAAYRLGVIDAEQTASPLPPNPFDGEDAGALMRWLSEPFTDPAHNASHEPELSRYKRAIRDLRPDLMAAFPYVPGKDTPRFLAWVEAERDGEWMRQYANGALIGPGPCKTARTG